MNFPLFLDKLFHRKKETKPISISTTIYDLNDDVLRETFEYLNIEQLYIMSDVCTRFRRVAREEFASRGKIVTLTDSEIIREMDINSQLVYLGYPYWVPFIRRFGDVITSIHSFSRRRAPMPFLKAIAEYCSQSLLELELNTTVWTQELILEWQPILAGLRKFELIVCEFDSNADASRLLSFCVELRSLTIAGIDHTFFGSPVDLPQLNSLELHGITGTNRMISNLQPSLARIKNLTLWDSTFESDADASQMFSFCVELHSLILQSDIDELVSPVALPKLKSLDLSDIDVEIDITTVERWLALNPQLEDIKLPPFSGSQTVRMVHQNVPNIVKMMFSFISELEDVDWKMFKNLKSLYIGASGSVMPVLKAVAEADIPLERLRLDVNYYFNRPNAELIQVIAELNHLRAIEMNSGHQFTLNDILNIVRTVPELETLSLGSMELPYAVIPEIIKCGPKLQSLPFGMFGLFDEFAYDDLFLRIRDAVLDHSQHRPFRFQIDGLRTYNQLRVSEKLLKANSHILQFGYLFER